MARLTDDELGRALPQLRGWNVANEALVRALTFSTFADAMAFANLVADVAEEAAHYPELALAGSTLTLRLRTPEEDGITARDLALARRINALLGR